MKKICVVFLWLSSLACSTMANELITNISITEGYVRESIPGAENSSAYMTINNGNKTDVSLIKVTSEISNRIEIHEHVMENDMMFMRKKEQLNIAANTQVTLQPFGYHLMIFDLKKPLTDGEKVTLTLYFDHQATKTVEFEIKGLQQKTQHHHQH